MSATQSMKHLNEDDVIRLVLRELGLTDRSSRRNEYGVRDRRADFSVRGHINEGHYRRTCERIREFTYVTLYSREAHDAVVANRELIEARTAELGRPWYVTTRTSQATGTVYADVSTYRPRGGK